MYDFTKQYDAKILIKGKTATEYHHTDGNIYIEGRKGSEYELEFYNNSRERVCIIPAVDGLSILDGKPAGLESDGYVVDAWQTLRIPGWKFDNNQIAKFEFSTKGSSYSNGTNNGTNNVGVIGFMIFREEIQHLDPITICTTSNSGGYAGSLKRDLSGIINNANDVGDLYRDMYNNSPISNTTGDYLIGATRGMASGSDSVADNMPIASSLGTGFGALGDYKTQEVSFNKRDPLNPDAVMVIYYDNVKGLEKRGIVVKKKRTHTSPDAFPEYTNSTTSTGCTPPRNWQG